MSTTTSEVRPDQLIVADPDRTETRRRGPAVVALVAVAVLATAAWAAWSSDQPDPGPSAAPEGVATSFMAALAAHDTAAAETLFAADVNLAPWTGVSDPDDSLRAWRLDRARASAGSTELIPVTCDEFSGAHPAGTLVRCAFGFGSLRTEPGAGLMSDGVVTVRVQDGEIVMADIHDARATEGFYEQVWEPFVRD